MKICHNIKNLPLIGNYLYFIFSSWQNIGDILQILILAVFTVLQIQWQIGSNCIFQCIYYLFQLPILQCIIIVSIILVTIILSSSYSLQILLLF